MATVLVVDDEADIRDLVKINLEIDGHDVLVAASGPEALALVSSRTPDLIILDVMMEGLDGWEVLGRIKADALPARAQIPVLMLTARAGELDAVRGGIEGAIHYMTKPFSLQELHDEVERALTGEPEPVKRRRAQNAAMARLARIERGSAPAVGQPGPRPRLTRLEGPPRNDLSHRPAPTVAGLAQLSPKQLLLIRAVGSSPTVREAAEHLQVSRSNVYASLRRIARKLGVRSVPELVGLARQGSFDAP
jgi:CheY-like chemotaxis protein/DNA-binding CsgD family transcriptional regulator